MQIPTNESVLGGFIYVLDKLYKGITYSDNNSRKITYLVNLDVSMIRGGLTWKEEGQLLKKFRNEGYISFQDEPDIGQVETKPNNQIKVFEMYKITVNSSFDNFYQEACSQYTENDFPNVDMRTKGSITIHGYGQNLKVKANSNEYILLEQISRDKDKVFTYKELERNFKAPKSGGEDSSPERRVRDIVQSIRTKFGKKIENFIEIDNGVRLLCAVIR